MLLEAVLPLRHYDINDAVERVAWIQNKNHAAYLSHRRKNIAKRK